MKLGWQYDETYSGYLEPDLGFDSVRSLYERMENHLTTTQRAELSLEIADFEVVLPDAETGNQYSAGPVVISEKLLLSCDKFDL